MYKNYLQNVRRRARLAWSDNFEENAYLSSLVDSTYYSDATNLTFHTDEDAARHFLSKGITEGLSPSSFFPAKTGLSGKRLRDYFLSARMNGPSSGWFDAEYYRKSNPDLSRSVIPPFEHFVRWGISENRNPNPFFDPSWYEASYERRREEGWLSPFRRFATYGDQRCQAPARWLLPLFDHHTPESGTVLERLGRVTAAVKPLSERLGLEALQFLVGLFYSHTYDGGGTLDSRADGVDRLVHFLTDGLEKGLDPGPLFEGALYDEAGEIPVHGGERLVHFLQKGFRHKAPTRLYDDGAYRSANADLRDPNYWTFRHFVMHGLFEGRSTGSPRAYMARLSGDLANHSLGNWQRFWAQNHPQEVFSAAPQSVARGEARMRDIIASATFQQSIELACALEPSLGNVPDYALVLPPVYDMREAARVELLGRFRHLSYDAIVCAPFLRTGGADLVACLLAEALSKNSQRRVLLLRTDDENFERPDWVPEQIDTVDISDIMKKLPRPQAEEYFYSLLLGLSPKQVFNVNSNLCWRTFARYGARLSRLVGLYSYLFCWDRDVHGHRVGYPSDFYTATAANLSGVFTDTEYLRNELLKLHRPPADVARRLMPLFSPIRETPKDMTPAAATAATRTRARPRILWAGRLDRQKRFDLAVDIARAMPDVDFVCWGADGIDAVSLSGDLPVNLTLNGAFKSYEELPLHDADVWLFTSAWEGMPTLIIELAVRGVPIVASAVGGVPELIDESTGYPIPSDAGPQAYVDGLREALADPEERVERARCLQSKALERHSRSAYVRRLEQILSEEV